MPSSIIYLLAVLLIAIAAVIEPHAQELDLLDFQSLSRRTLKLHNWQSGNDAFCFGPRSICLSALDLDDTCPGDSVSTEAWITCRCTSGAWFSTRSVRWCCFVIDPLEFWDYYEYKLILHRCTWFQEAWDLPVNTTLTHELVLVAQCNFSLWHLTKYSVNLKVLVLATRFLWHLCQRVCFPCNRLIMRRGMVVYLVKLLPQRRRASQGVQRVL
jgi:hypothetical protein